ncbi:hypothetical protein [Bradyrhizobium sp.]|uniref:hypothetical protein n=1 Tax=Bradyrhizobium sp. TaxID=376 RepID=UPI001DECF1F3|nr:hypothetical protein [Bradyrhizobium sp.]MBI5321414.1 hypothetical protein [Bradyrhizobium sp.]
MMILSEHGNYQPLGRLQTWLLVRLIAVQLGSDLRWGLLALALNLVAAAWAFGCRKLVSARREGTSGRQNPADTMVAAGLR